MLRLHHIAIPITLNPMSPLQQAKLMIVDHLHLGKDALHIYVALVVFIGSCILFKWKAKQWKPWLVVLAVVLTGEVWDIRDSMIYDAPVVLAGNWKDIWNSMLVPTALMLLARYSNIFGKDKIQKS